MTGAGMMDCKRALQEADGDLEKAQELLRAQGPRRRREARRAHRQDGPGRGLHPFQRHGGRRSSRSTARRTSSRTPTSSSSSRRTSRCTSPPVGPAVREPRRRPEGHRRRRAQDLRGPGQGDGQARQRHPEHRRGQAQGLLRADGPARPDVREGRLQDRQQLLDEVGAKVGEKVAVRRFARFKLGEERVGRRQTE